VNTVWHVVYNGSLIDSWLLVRLRCMEDIYCFRYLLFIACLLCSLSFLSIFFVVLYLFYGPCCLILNKWMDGFRLECWRPPTVIWCPPAASIQWTCPSCMLIHFCTGMDKGQKWTVCWPMAIVAGLQPVCWQASVLHDERGPAMACLPIAVFDSCSFIVTVYF